MSVPDVPKEQNALDLFREALLAAKKAKGLSFRDIGEAAEMSQTLVCELTKGTRMPTFDTIDKIARVLAAPKLVDLAETAVIWHWRHRNGPDQKQE